MKLYGNTEAKECPFCYFVGLWVGQCPRCHTVMPKHMPPTQTVKEGHHPVGDGGFMHTYLKEKGVMKW